MSNITTEIPEQKKTTSLTPNDQATDKTKSSLTNLNGLASFMLSLSLSLMHDQLEGRGKQNFNRD